jgi:hypothetical protein
MLINLTAQVMIDVFFATKSLLNSTASAFVFLLCILHPPDISIR